MSFGIGQLFGAVGGVGKELLRAGAHGVAGGVASMVGGGNAGAGFASGALSSGIGSLSTAAHMGGAAMVVQSSLSGGLSSLIAGGDFLRGALQGLCTAVFNHLPHNIDNPIPEPLYFYEDGINWVDLPDVVCMASAIQPDPINDALSCGIVITTILNGPGHALKKYSGNSTYSPSRNGSRPKFYFKSEHQRAFYGNQYVRTIPLKYVGKCITRVTGPVGYVLGGFSIWEGWHSDNRNGNSDYYRTTRAAVSFLGGMAGSAGLAQLGSYIGGSIGTCICPVAGSIVGAAIGSVVGGLVGSYLSEYAVDVYMKPKYLDNEFKEN